LRITASHAFDPPAASGLKFGQERLDGACCRFRGDQKQEVRPVDFHEPHRCARLAACVRRPACRSLVRMGHAPLLARSRPACGHFGLAPPLAPRLALLVDAAARSGS
jgi:hypothetical protein